MDFYAKGYSMGLVLELHRHLFKLQYRPHMLAKLRVAMTVRMGHAVLGPELLPGHTFVAQVGKGGFQIGKQRGKPQLDHFHVRIHACTGLAQLP